MNTPNYLVTGANSGIGKEIALALLKTGANIIVIDKVKADELLSESSVRQNKGTIDAYIADLSSTVSIKDVVEQISTKYSHIDALVNNAGRHLMAREESVDGYEMNFALNCLGSFTLTWLLLDKLKAAQAGRIINISSEAHRVPGHFDMNDINTNNAPMSYAYGRSKFGVILWTKALARKLQDTSVTVNTVCPGLVKTQIFENFVPKWLLPFTVLMTKVGLMATPEQGSRKPVELLLSQKHKDSTGKFYGSHAVLKQFSENKGTDNQQLQNELLNKLISIVQG
ncbi:MAG: SDR family NAD(P)-dependent oxidoreductase [Pseudomonadales bacterium]|nr:SDR family NAD(P)-dependent oxidoreductase [Pseudomonadales bacterium]